MSLFLVLTAAGSSSRMGQMGKKEYLPLGGGTVLSQSLKAFLEAAHFTAVVITVPAGGEGEAQAALSKDGELEGLLPAGDAGNRENQTFLAFVEGGSSRQSSIYNALAFLKGRYAIGGGDVVLVHDAARPYVTTEIIQDCIACTVEHGAAVPAIPAVDTQKEISPDATIARHLDREKLAAVQTPQGFLLAPFILCHEQARSEGLDFTDDTRVWDFYPQLTGGKKVHIVKGDIVNKKITYPSDLATLDDRAGRDVPSDGNAPTGTPPFKRQSTAGQPEIRIGMGTDLHKLVEGRRFLLGGVEIPAEKGELGHSDADVLLHAITDALLGASGLGDIGSYFPPEEAKWKDADSSLLIKQVWEDVKKEGWSLVNLDCVLEFERPKFLPWREKVISSVATILGVDESRVFVKAKTNEGLDAVGSSLAVKAYCVCLLTRSV